MVRQYQAEVCQEQKVRKSRRTRKRFIRNSILIFEVHWTAPNLVVVLLGRKRYATNSIESVTVQSGWAPLRKINLIDYFEEVFLQLKTNYIIEFYNNFSLLENV